MKKMKYLLPMLFLLSGCQYLKSKFQTKNNPSQHRSVAQNPSEASRYYDIKSINTFNTLMSRPLFENDANGKPVEVFINHVRKFVEQDFDYLYIGQSFMHDFDKELDRLVKLKRVKKKLDDDDTEKINLIYFQLQVARELYEQNLHELADLYQLTLEARLAADITNDQEIKTKTTLVLSQIPGWLDQSWENKFKIGVISIAEVIDDVNERFIKTTPAASRYAINVERFSKISNRVRHQAYLESTDPDILDHFDRLSRHIEGSARKRFEESFDRLQSNPERLMTPFFESENNREPKALDDLYPSADGHGHISGKLVPANTWAMTLDDGPHPIHTPGMIKAFNDNKVPVTFFWLSKNMNLYPDLVAQARGNFKATGNHFYVASHSMTHANLPTLSEKDLEVEITDAAKVFEKIVGERPTLFRCPYGACGPIGKSKIREIIARNNMIHVHWTVDPLDWQDKNPQTIVERTQKQIELRGKGIVLFHDVHPQSVEALKIIIPYMKNKKYRMLSMPQMITEIREKDFYSP